MNWFRKFVRLVVISRPIAWLPTTGLYFGGALVSADASITWAVVWGLIFFTMPVGIVVYGLNDIGDRESDEQNSRKGLVEGAVIRVSEVPFIVWSALITTAIFFVPLMITGHYWGALGVLAQLVLAYLYSIRPFHWKGVPVLDLLSVAVVIIAAFMTGFFMNAAGWTMPAWPATHVLLVLAFCAAAVHALHEVLDHDVDKRAGDTTITVVIGKRPALAMCAAFFLGCLLLVINGTGTAYTVATYYFAYAIIATTIVAFLNKRKAISWLMLSLMMLVPAIALYILVV